MTEKKKYYYLYGKYKGSEIPSSLFEKWDLIIYVDPKFKSMRTINSLEGMFISEEYINHTKNIELKLNEKRVFELQYHGKFIPFEELNSVND